MNLARLAEENLERFGEYDALFFEGRWYRNTEWLADARRFANVLVTLGLEPGDRVAVLMPNATEVFQVSGGTTAMGGEVVPIVFLLAPPEIRHILEDARPRVLVTTPLFLDKVGEAVGGLENPPRLLVVGEPVPEGADSFGALVADASPEFETVDRDDDDVALLMYTGGTTGRAKGVMLSHGNLRWNAVTLAEAVQIGRDTVSLLCLPVAHLFGMITSITGQVLGTRGVMLEWFTPDGVLQAIQEHDVNYVSLVPTMMTMLLHHPDVDRYDTSSLRRVFVSAAPVPIELAEAFEKRFDCEVLEGYGQTEAAPAIALMRPGLPKKAGSTGPPLLGVEVRIVDEEGEEVPAGEVGEIVARGPGVMKGYRNLPEETAETLRGGWLHTGDMGHLDEDGYLYVTDRKGVAEVAVVGRPDERLGEEVVAFVVPARGTEASEEELIAFCQERLAKFKSPKQVLFVPELPKSPIGKVLKRELRRDLSE